MLARQHVLAARQRSEEVVVEKAPGECAMRRGAGQPKSEELIFRQRLAFVPGVLTESLARSGGLVAWYRVRRQVWHGRRSGARQRGQRSVVVRQLRGIDETTDQFVAGAGGKAVVALERAVRIDGCRIAVHETADLRPRGLVPGDRANTRQRAQPLSDRGAGREAPGVVTVAQFLPGRS